MSSSNLQWQKNIWSLIDNYFVTNKNYISQNQLDSYNIFLKNQIPKTIRQFNPMIFTKGEHDYYDHTNIKKTHYIHKIEFIVGGSINEDGTKVYNDGKGIYLSKPIIQELVKDPIRIHADSVSTKKSIEIEEKEDVLEETEIIKDVRVKQLFPNEARLKNLTYKTLISCDIFVIITNVKIINKTPVLYKGDIQTYRNVPLGNIPIMVKSNLCVLSNMPKPILYEMGECIYDQGGYFIINGKEKVIISQERQVENRLYIQKNNVDPKIQYELSIRSVPENIFQPARITRVYMTDTNAIYVKIPHCNGLKIRNKKDLTNFDIPLFLIFRALGTVSDKDIIHSIIDINHSELSKNVMDILQVSINELYERKPIFSQHDALQELSTYINVPNKNVLPPEDMKLIMLQDILRNYFIPHLGKTPKEKSVFLSHMVKELILVKLGIRQITDKDNFMNKRVDTSGYLIGTIFRDLYFRVKNNLRDTLNRSYSSIKPTLEEADIEWAKPLGDITNDRTQLDNFIGSKNSTISVISINDLFQRRILDEGFLYAFKNCWGLKNARGCKQGIVQDLNRLSFLGYLSHLRRLNTSIPSGAKIRAPHSLNSSTFGIICPCETPDGGNIGLRKNLAITAKVTFGTNSDSFKKLLDSLEMISIYDMQKKNIHSFTKIFLNEKIVGYHEYPKHLCYMLRLYKRNALINIYTSISWYVMDNIVKISTTSGRCCRPLLVVRHNACLLTDTHIENIKKNTIDWNYLVGGTRTTDFISKKNKTEPYIDDNNLLVEFNKKDYSYVHSKDMTLQECLEHYSGVIEYVDTEEANNSLIALTPHDLEKSDVSYYNYCEIHPTMLFGIIANNIPLMERNQAPRNQFATVHGKQALGVYATNFKNRMDTKVQVMFYPQKPLIQSIYSKYLFTDQIPHGINAIVAVACYTGYNQEDSLIFNKSSIERGLFRTVKFRTYSEREEINNSGKNKEEICFPDERFTRGMKLGNYSKLDKKTGIIPENTHVTDSDIVVGKVMYTGEKDINGNKLYSDNSLIVKRHESGIIDKIHYNTGNDDQNYIKLRLRKDKIPEIGDKFCSRFGQKGTIGMVLPAEDMPFTQNGIVPDIVMNPHALPSRMTLGQILEVIMGKVSVESGKIAKLASFSNINEPLIGTVLEELGYEKCANEVLYNGIDGKQLKVNIFMGPTYYQRLVHQVADKMNSRTSGPQTSLAHQPVGGRSIGGGLRIGEMERDSLLAHGMSYFIKESFMERSDKYSFYISNKSGLLAIVNKEKKIFEDFSKDETKIKVNREGYIEKFSNKVSDADFICIEAPYTFKLFLQEIESMGVALRLVTSDIFTQWEYLTEGKIKVQDTLSMQDGDISVHNIASSETTPDTTPDTKTDTPPDSTQQYYVSKTSNLSRPLNKFHNKVKEVLLDNKSNNLCNITDIHKALLDTSIGRGGDIWKWYNYKYTTILGFDIDVMGIENMGDHLGGDGAKKRLEQIKIEGTNEQKKWARESKIFFAVADTSKNIRELKNINENYTSIVREAYRYMPENSFDTVSSQFTVHYYFENESKIKQYLQNVQTNIKKDGYLLITCLDGESVYNLLKKHKNSTRKNNYEGYIKDPIVGSTKVWGINSSELDITRDVLPNNTFNEVINVYYDSIGREQKEYLVHKQHLIQLAASYDLFLLSDTETQTNFNTLQHGSDMFKNIYPLILNKNKKNKHIRSLGYAKNNNLKKYSDLHRYYIFRYIPDISEEQKGLLLNQSLQMLQHTQTITNNSYAIKYSYMPEHLLSSFTEPIKRQEPEGVISVVIKNRIEEKYNGSIIVYKNKEQQLLKLLQKEKELKESGTINESSNDQSIANTELLIQNLEKQEKYEDSLVLCEQLIKLLDNTKGKGNTQVKTLLKQKYTILIQLERYEDSIVVINELITLSSGIDLTLQNAQASSKIRKNKSILQSDLAYNYYKLNNIEKSTELYNDLNKNIHSIFNKTEQELYNIQIKECEILLSMPFNFIDAYNRLVTIIEDIHREINEKDTQYKLLEYAFSLLYKESKESVELENITYNKMAIIAKKQDIPNICLDISKFRQDNIIDRDHKISFGVIIPYYDEDGDITSLQSGGTTTEDVEENMDESSESVISLPTKTDIPSVPGVPSLVSNTLVIKPDSNISKIIKNVEELYENELELGACSIYIVKQTKKEIAINKELYHEHSFYDINDEQTTGFLKYNKGSLINTGYTLAKKDNKKYMIIMNSNLLYDVSFTTSMITYPNQPEFIGRLKTTSNIQKYVLDIIKINVQDYETINGSPNDIWDPSLCDKILYNRIKNTKLKSTSSLVHKTDDIQILNDNEYNESVDYRRTEDYLHLDKLSRQFSGINQEHNTTIVYNNEVSKNINIVDVEYTLATKPFETSIVNEEGQYEHFMNGILNTVDIDQSPLDIAFDIITSIIQINIGIEDIEINRSLHTIKVDINSHLYNNIFKSLYFENRLRYMISKISYIFTLLQDKLLHKKITHFSFDSYDSVCRIEYIYNPSIGFEIFIYEDFIYQPEKKHILDNIYTHRNQINALQEKYNNIPENIQSIIDTFSQSDNLEIIDIIQNNVIYIDIHTQTLQYYIIKKNGEESGNRTYSLEKRETPEVDIQEDEESQSIFNLLIIKNPEEEPGITNETIKELEKDSSNVFMYVKHYNVLYNYIKNRIDTEYVNKLNMQVFSEQMPKEYFNKDKTYDGLQFGYKEHTLSFDRFTKELLKKSYRLGIMYNSSNNFIINSKDNEKIQQIKQNIDTLDKETFCESNKQAIHTRTPIVDLYKNMLQQAEYVVEPTPELTDMDVSQQELTQPIQEDTPQEDTPQEDTPQTPQEDTPQTPQEDTGKLYQPNKLLQGGYTPNKDYFSIEHMKMIQKGGNKNNIIGVRKKILYLLKGLPIKYIKQFQFDVEALYSVTKYAYANKISKLLLKLKGIDHTSSILECMSCVGGNSISFLQYFNNCVFVEKDSHKIDMLTNNISELANHISKKIGNFSILNEDINTLIASKKHNILQKKYDIVFVDPPWGGKHYKYSKNINIKIDNQPLSEFVHTLKDITRYVVLKLPFNYDIDNLQSTLHNDFEMIHVHDIKNSKDKIKMKIIIIEISKKNLFNTENIINSIKKITEVDKNKKKIPNMSIELEIDTSNDKIDSIDKSIFNIKDHLVNTDTLHIPDSDNNYKHITIRNTHNNDSSGLDTSHKMEEMEEMGEMGEMGECSDTFIDPVEEDIQSIDSVFHKPTEKNIKRIRIIKKIKDN